MSKDPKEARDRGFADGVAAKNDDRDVISKTVGDFFDPPYKGDSDYPETYREAFKEGKK